MNDTGGGEADDSHTWLAQALSLQPWQKIGNCEWDDHHHHHHHPPITIAATSDLDVMVDQLTSILEFRLTEVVKSREKNNSSGIADKPNDSTAASDEHSSRPPFLQPTGVLNTEVREELRSYVADIGRKYNAVHYHSFQHAAHVTISMNKLLSMMMKFYALCHDASFRGENEASPDTFQSRRSTLQHVECRKERSGLERTGSTRSECDGDHGGGTAQYDTTFGIGADPLARFALVFSALIHDVDHRGVSNDQLVDEAHDLSIVHNDISIAEQNSLQVAFSTLMRPEFATLKTCLMPTTADRKAFRKLVIDVVLVTDISSPDRMQLAKSKWREAFQPSRNGSFSDECNKYGQQQQSNRQQAGTDLASDEHNRDMECWESQRRRHSMFTSQISRENLHTLNLGIRRSLHLNGQIIDAYASNTDGDSQLRASTVMELMMNVADVAHLMQGFDIFCKWNRRLYKELIVAYRDGRNAWDPAVNWYHNQINFLDAYVIPLAQKLEVCGSFGNQGSLPLYFALENKRRWTAEGYELTREMKESVAQEIMSERSNNGT